PDALAPWRSCVSNSLPRGITDLAVRAAARSGASSFWFSRRSCLSSPSCHGFDAFPLLIRHRHHRQPRPADERTRLEPRVGFNLLRRDRPPEFAYRRDVDDGGLAGGVLRIHLRVAERFRDADDRLLVTGVIVEDAVALPDRVQMFLREGV